MPLASPLRDPVLEEEHRDETRPPAVATRGRILAPEERATWWMELHRWVSALRHDYAFLWPDEGMGGNAMRELGMRSPNYRAGFPSCWYKHPGLVEELALLRAGQEALIEGKDKTSPLRDGLDWSVYLHTIIAPAIAAISEQCRRGHANLREQHGHAQEREGEELRKWLRLGLEPSSPQPGLSPLPR